MCPVVQAKVRAHIGIFTVMGDIEEGQLRKSFPQCAGSQIHPDGKENDLHIPLLNLFSHISQHLTLNRLHQHESGPEKRTGVFRSFVGMDDKRVFRLSRILRVCIIRKGVNMQADKTGQISAQTDIVHCSAVRVWIYFLNEIYSFFHLFNVILSRLSRSLTLCGNAVFRA